MKRNTITPEQAKRLAAILRRHRQQRHLSMRQIALRAGVSVATLATLEAGTTLGPQPSTLKALAEVLQIDLGQLYTDLNWLPAKPLPNLAPYMRAKYHELPESAIAELERYADQLIKRHGGLGPIDGEDERPEAETSSS
jgi:transcriptional regulator with XRE-family HTH domain